MPTARTLLGDQVDRWVERLADAARDTTRVPGPGKRPQPVHTYYLAGDRFTPATVPQVREEALGLLTRHAPDADRFADVFGLAPAAAEAVHVRTRLVLDAEPIQDLRLDFEDGYGNRTDPDEDGDVSRAAGALIEAGAAGTAPPEIGIRVKPLTDEHGRRSLRTLDVFLTTLAGQTVPPIVVTLPKVTSEIQAGVFGEAVEALAEDLRVDNVATEIMIETTDAVVDDRGSISIRRLADAAGPRLRGVHFGAYDYTASCGIVAAHQHLRHTSCDFAREMIRLALASTGLWWSDGGTSVLPAPPGDAAAVRRGWRLHAAHVQHGLVNGYYQGWDVHPGQLPARHAAGIAFYLEGMDEAEQRVAAHLAGTSPAAYADEPATVRALLDFLVRAINAGATTTAEVASRTGLPLEALGAPLMERPAT